MFSNNVQRNSHSETTKGKEKITMADSNG